ncbi:MAG: heavy-metal-associated domain-containing protein [Candidatus Hinthialibacter antarcticus]|nr:heavy-metal-associated domain-containing protein [Candidatus Hinthialibacter antarcticus]
MTSTTFLIEGMTCGHCVKSATKALESIPGVSSVQVELDSKQAVVEYDSGQTNEDALFDAVQQADFTPVKKKP